MPTYAYRCTVCDQSLEVKQSFTDDSLTVCPECGGQLRKLFSSVGVVFKGSGFYRTDSRKESRPVSSSAGSSTSESSSAGSSANGSSGKGSSSSGSSGTASSGSSSSGASTSTSKAAAS